MEQHMSQVTETVSCESLRQHIEQEQEVIFWGQGYRITRLLINAVLGDGKKLAGIQPLNTRPNYYVIRVDSGWDLSNWGDGDLFVDDLEDVYEAIEDQFSEIEREREYLIEDGVSPERADLAYYPEELGWPVFSLDSGVGWFELDSPRKSVDRMTPADLRAICDSLDDERGTGGQSNLARLLGWHHSTVWRKLTGKSPIIESDSLAIQKTVETPSGSAQLQRR
jgi:hypothetical protein